MMDKILNEVVRLENQGYQFENAGASFDLLVKRVAGTYSPHFSPIKYRVVAGDRSSDQKHVFAEANERAHGDEDVLAVPDELEIPV